MTYSFAEIIDYLIQDDSFNEDYYDDLYDLCSSEWGSHASIELNDFEWNGKKYEGKTFNFNKKAKKVLDDYCEGKTQYHYNIKLEDLETKECYEIICSHYNDEMTGVEIISLGKKKVKDKKDCCDKKDLVSISGKCNDLFSYKNQDEDWKAGSPRDLNLGKSDYIEFTYCRSCGKIHFKK